jgi:AcrR family transcriptional regulator
VSQNHDRHSEIVTAKIRDSFISLLKEKDILTITMKEIAEHADVSRGTLYFHYDDKFDMFQEIVTEKAEGLRKAIYNWLKKEEFIDLQHMNLKVHPTLSYVAENKLFFRAMMNRNKRPYINFHDFFLQIFSKDVLLYPLNQYYSPMEQDLFKHYRVLYTYSIILYWMKEGMERSPELISKQVWDLISQKRFYWLFGSRVEDSSKDEHHLDRRIIRTRQALQEAMGELILEKKDYSAITISDIARRGNIRRATFYDHYSSKEELLSAMIENSCLSLIEIFTVDMNPEELTLEKSEEILVTLFSYLSEHTSIVHFINADFGIPDPIPEMLQHLSRFYLKQPMNIHAGKEIYAYYVSGMIIGLILYRLNEGSTQSPQFLAKEFIKFLDLKKYKIILL